MSIKKTIKNSLKAVISTYAEAQARSKRIQFDDNTGKDLLFATGFDKSGTTWLMGILDFHPEVVCRGSGQIFNFYAENTHFLGDRGGYGEFVVNGLNSRWFGKGGRVWFDEDAVKLNFRNFIATSFKRYNIKNGRIFGDKSTVQDVKLIRDLFPDTKIICMVRDCRDVAVSFAYHFKRGGKADKFNEDGSFNQDYLIKAATAWLLYSQHIRKNLSDKNLLIVKYEDLLGNPEKEITRIYNFIGVSISADLLKKVIGETSFENLSGGRPAGVQDESSYFRKGIAGDWENHFGENEKKILKEIAGEELINWGYEDNLDW